MLTIRVFLRNSSGSSAMPAWRSLSGRSGKWCLSTATTRLIILLLLFPEGVRESLGLHSLHESILRGVILGHHPTDSVDLADVQVEHPFEDGHLLVEVIGDVLVGEAGELLERGNRCDGHVHVEEDVLADIVLHEDIAVPFLSDFRYL